MSLWEMIIACRDVSFAKRIAFDHIILVIAAFFAAVGRVYRQGPVFHDN